MSYEDAPGTKMLATSCASCGRPLLDAESVTAGMGPDCREKHGMPATLSDETRAEANRLVYVIALAGRDCPEVRAALTRLSALGCTALVARISKRFFGAPVEILIDGAVIAVRSGYSAGFVDETRRIPGRRWDGAQKRTTFPIEQWRALESALVTHYHGCASIAALPSPDNGELVTAVSVVVAAGMLAPYCSGVTTKAKPPTPIKVVRDKAAERIAVHTPYDGWLVAEMKAVEGRRWDGEANTFPAEAEEAVLALCRRAFGNVHIVAVDGAVKAPTPRRGGRRSWAYRYS